jgi:hypothetical protein
MEIYEKFTSIKERTNGGVKHLKKSRTRIQINEVSTNGTYTKKNKIM